jgi:hypothetical protein
MPSFSWIPLTRFLPGVSSRKMILTAEEGQEPDLGGVLPQGPEYTITNVVENRDIDGLQTTIDALTATVATLIGDLRRMGLLK